jgi:hypothetical protein
VHADSASVGSTAVGEPTMADGSRDYKVRIGMAGVRLSYGIKSADQAVMGIEDLARAG